MQAGCGVHPLPGGRQQLAQGARQTDGRLRLTASSTSKAAGSSTDQRQARRQAQGSACSAPPWKKKRADRDVKNGQKRRKSAIFSPRTRYPNRHHHACPVWTPRRCPGADRERVAKAMRQAGAAASGMARAAARAVWTMFGGRHVEETAERSGTRTGDHGEPGEAAAGDG